MVAGLRCVAVIVLLVMLAGYVVAADKISVRETVYRYGKTSAKAFVIKNRFFAATLVPDMGGRILKLIDNRDNVNLVYHKGYGGLLDDHGASINKAYKLKWLKRTDREVVVQLTLDGSVMYRKTISFYADRPALKVHYHIENFTQAPRRLLFRNVVRPSGEDFKGHELYCYSRVVGLQKSKGMPCTDDQADPWCALVDPKKKIVVANAFEGDALERLYTWRGSKVAPTYEFMFRQLLAGKQVDFDYYWVLGRGLTAVDYANRNFIAEVDGGFKGENLEFELKMLGTWQPMPDLEVAASVLDPKRQQIAELAAFRLSVPVLDKVVATGKKLRISGNHKYVILLLTLNSKQLEQPIVIEKAFPLNGDRKFLKEYRRPIRWLGKSIVQQPLADWLKEEKYRVQPDKSDRKRGYLVFEECGKRAGRHTEKLSFEMGRNEYESFPLHFYSLSLSGKVKIALKAPRGIRFESFVPEKVPEKLWGRLYHGLKLLAADSFMIKPKEDRVLYFRLKVAESVKPGNYSALITLSPEKGVAVTVKVQIKVYPVVFAKQPLMTFDASNVVNYLCADRIKGLNWRWNPEKAKNYLNDMSEHGIRGQSTCGTNSPAEHYWYSRVKVRESGLPLPEAIRKNPERFRNRLDMPKLDFSEWDPLIDFMLEHGMTHIRWPMGSCGRGFMQKHSRLTKMIYGKNFPGGDLRQMDVMEWYNRELSRYLRDRGITRVFVTIDDEIPSEELAWWVQHAYRSLQMGLEPGVTQSAHTLADDQLINMVSPFMRYWIIGTLNKKVVDLRRKQKLIKPGDRLITYHSSANHWQEYDQMRGYCGLNPAFFGLDACWIQTYYRWRQGEAVIYPTSTGPIDSAAWEGARDGLEDGNYYLLAKSMINALKDPEQKKKFTAKLAKIVGMRDDSLIKFTDKITGVGEVTVLGRQVNKRVFKGGYRTDQFRLAKKKLLDLITELKPLVPVQKAAAKFANHTLILNGKTVYRIPLGMKKQASAVDFLCRIAAPLEFNKPVPESVDDSKVGKPIFFLGQVDELKKLLPNLAKSPELADLNSKYPAPGGYVIRFVNYRFGKKAKKAKNRKKPAVTDAMEPSLIIVYADDAGLKKAMTNLAKVITQPRWLYSHWLSER